MVNLNNGKLKIKDLIDGYGRHNDERGLRTYKGKLVVYPEYKIINDLSIEQQHAIIDSIRCSRPIGELCVLDNGDGTYDLIDGQQRVLAICNFLIGKFEYYGRRFHQIEIEEFNVILNYELKFNII